MIGDVGSRKWEPGLICAGIVDTCNYDCGIYYSLLLSTDHVCLVQGHNIIFWQ